jgi:hypothetical protein
VCHDRSDFVSRVLTRLKAAGFRRGRGLIFSATHTHTAPYVTPLFGTAPDPDYLRGLEEKTVDAVLTAERTFAPVALRLGGTKSNALAFNRRYWMKGGGVTTNPGKRNPAIVKPEGPVDREIGVLSVEREGRCAAVVVNLVNHTDTIGGNRVSADWPGRMERGVQSALGYDPVVLTLIGCSGNINHFDMASDVYQTSLWRRAATGGLMRSRWLRCWNALKPLTAGRLTCDRFRFIRIACSRRSLSVSKR